MRARLDLALLELGRDLDPLGLLSRTIFEGPFEGEVYETADLFAVPDRNLAGDERGDADRLKR